MEDYSKYHCFIFDLDGTLAESKSPIDKQMGRLLSDLMKNKIIGIVTGGKWLQVKKQLIKRLPEDAYLRHLFVFCCSGGVGMQFCNSRWNKIYDHSFTEEENKKIINAIKESVEESGIKIGRTYGSQTELRGSQITWSGLGQEAPLKEKINFDVGGFKRFRIADLLSKKINGYEIRVNATSSIDITKKGINKAYAVRKLFETSHIQTQYAVFIGDGLYPGGNDEIVKETGIDVIKVNSPSDTKTIIRSVLHIKN